VNKSNNWQKMAKATPAHRECPICGCDDLIQVDDEASIICSDCGCVIASNIIKEQREISRGNLRSIVMNFHCINL
jgi:hypothetical protein